MFKRKSGAEQWVSYVFSVVFVKNCNIVLYEIPKMNQEIGMNPISLNTIQNSELSYWNLSWNSEIVYFSRL